MPFVYPDEYEKTAHELIRVCTCGADMFNELNGSWIKHDEDCGGAARAAVAQHLRDIGNETAVLKARLLE